MAAGLPPAEAAAGSVEDVDIDAEFSARALAFIDPAAIRPLKIVLDGGNGMAGPMVGPILERLDAWSWCRSYWEPDGEFPDHEPNPAAAREPPLRDRQGPQRGRRPRHRVGRRRRPLLLHRRRRRVRRRRLPHRAARAQVLESHPGADILYDVRASRAVADTVRAAGGTPLVNRVGHAFFKRRMRDEGGVFGGEVSGHYYFADFYNADSGTLPALLILELLGKQRPDARRAARAATARATSSRARSTPRSPTRPPRSRRSARATPTREITELDGISIDYEDWHFNVRPSNTEPLLRLCLESLVSRARHGGRATRCSR